MMTPREEAIDISETYELKDKEGKYIPDILIENVHFLLSYIFYIRYGRKKTIYKIPNFIDKDGNSRCPSCGLIVFTKKLRAYKNSNIANLFGAKINYKEDHNFCERPKCSDKLQRLGYVFDKVKMVHVHRPDCRLGDVTGDRIPFIWNEKEIGFLLFEEKSENEVTLKYIEIYEEFRGKRFFHAFREKIKNYFLPKYKYVNLQGVDVKNLNSNIDNIENCFMRTVIDRDIKDLNAYCKEMNYSEELTDIIFALRFYHLFFDGFDTVDDS